MSGVFLSHISSCFLETKFLPELGVHQLSSRDLALCLPSAGVMDICCCTPLTWMLELQMHLPSPQLVLKMYLILNIFSFIWSKVTLRAVCLTAENLGSM